MKGRAPRTAAMATHGVGGTARPGIALAAVVLALVVLEAVVAGALFVCSIEVATTRAFARRADAVLAAESGLAAALDAWDADAVAGLAPGGTVASAPIASPTGNAEARIERLRGSAYRVTGRSGLPGPGGHDLAAAAALVAWHPPGAFAADATAALVVGGPTVVAAGALVDGRGTGTGCTPGDTLAAATFPAAAGIAATSGTTPVLAIGAMVLGTPSIAPGALDSAAYDGFGPFDVASLARAAERVEGGAVSLAPVAGTAGCERSAPGNWGAHRGSGHPCADFLPLVHAPGDLSILGGTGFGLVLVDGDLTLEPGAVLHGIALVRGRATVRGELRGLLRAAAGADVEGTIVRDACAIWKALTRARPLSRPFRADRWRLPWF